MAAGTQPAPGPSSPESPVSIQPLSPVLCDPLYTQGFLRQPHFISASSSPEKLIMGLGSTRSVCHLRTSSHCTALFILTGHIRLKPRGCGGLKKKVECSCDTAGGTGALELLAGVGETAGAGLVAGLPRNVSACVPAQVLGRLQFCDPVDCSPPGASVHGILQARVSCHFLFQWNFRTQGSNLCLLHLLNWQADSRWATWAAPRNVSS